jgi:uncharacterized protein YbjT (DUF2867 family)
MTTIAVVGATGNIGHELTALLLKQGVKVRAVGRSAERLAALAAGGAEPWVGSADDSKFLSEAFRGADGVFAMIPPDYGNPDPRGQQRRFAEAMASATQVARVRHAVTLSSIGADKIGGTGPIDGLRGLEERFDQIPGLNVVHLRPGYFYENFLGSIGLIKGSGINGGLITPDAPKGMVATRDIASVAAELLGGLGFSGRQTRELQGPRDYSFGEATKILGAAIGRPDLAYVTFGEQDLYNALTGTGFSSPMAQDFIEMLQAFNAGRVRFREPRSPSNTTPTTFESFAETVFAPAFNR